MHEVRVGAEMSLYKKINLINLVKGARDGPPTNGHLDPKEGAC